MAEAETSFNESGNRGGNTGEIGRGNRGGNTGEIEEGLKEGQPLGKQYQIKTSDGNTIPLSLQQSLIMSTVYELEDAVRTLDTSQYPTTKIVLIVIATLSLVLQVQ